MPGLPVHHQLPEFTQTHVHWVSDAIQLSHLLSSPSPPVLNLSQHRGLFKWVSSSHQVAKISLYMFKIFLSLIQQVRVCVCVCVCISHVWLFAALWNFVYGIFQARILDWVDISYCTHLPTWIECLLCLLHCQADYLPLCHLGNPVYFKSQLWFTFFVMHRLGKDEHPIL